MTDEPRPPLLHHHATTSTLPALQPDGQPVTSGDFQSEAVSQNNHRDAEAKPSSIPDWEDIAMFIGIFVMLIWPWIFVGVVWTQKGLKMNNRLAEVVLRHWNTTTYFITFISTTISSTITSLFSFAILRFTQELITRHRTRDQRTHPFHLFILFALKDMYWPWGIMETIKNLGPMNRLWYKVLLIICVLAVSQLSSSISSLLFPTLFSRHSNLNGTELDFSSTDPVCLDWFKAHPISNNCDWVEYKNQLFSCLGKNQVIDILDAGRDSLGSLSNSEPLTFSQLGGIRFLRSIRGVLPIGPDGVPGFDTISGSPLSDRNLAAYFYDYSLFQQGVTSTVKCRYQSTSPIVYTSPSANLLQYNVPNCTALGETDVLTNVSNYTSQLGTKTLMYWACQSATNSTQEPSYSIYLLGYRGYEQNIGNVTCTLSPLRPGLFNVTFTSPTRTFSVDRSDTKLLVSSAPSAFSLLANLTLEGLGQAISEAQNIDHNLVAESVIMSGVKFFNLQPNAQNDSYLRLYEAMIEGILEYETTYIRLLYSTISNPPPSCVRSVTGVMNYDVFGWFVTNANIGFLIPLTLINGSSLIALIVALTFAKTEGYFPVDHPRKINHDLETDEPVPDEWRHKVVPFPTTVMKEVEQETPERSTLIRRPTKEVAQSEKEMT